MFSAEALPERHSSNSHSINDLFIFLNRKDFTNQKYPKILPVPHELIPDN